MALSILPRSHRLMSLDIAQHQEKVMSLYSHHLPPASAPATEILATKSLSDCKQNPAPESVVFTVNI